MSTHRRLRSVCFVFILFFWLSSFSSSLREYTFFICLWWVTGITMFRSELIRLCKLIWFFIWIGHSLSVSCAGSNFPQKLLICAALRNKKTCLWSCATSKGSAQPMQEPVRLAIKVIRLLDCLVFKDNKTNSKGSDHYAQNGRLSGSLMGRICSETDLFLKKGSILKLCLCSVVPIILFSLVNDWRISQECNLLKFFHEVLDFFQVHKRKLGFYPSHLRQGKLKVYKYMYKEKLMVL